MDHDLARTADGPDLRPAPSDDQREIAALLDRAAALLRAADRPAAVVTLRSAVAIDPAHLGAHRRLAATLANAGDVGGAVAEYERFVHAVTAAGRPDRATAERHYGHALLGDAIPLRSTPPAPRVAPDLVPAPTQPYSIHPFDDDRSEALRHLAVAAVALVATVAAMLIAGSRIFAQGL